MTTPGLRERKKEQTRERLTAAAFRLFQQRGYEGATVELIAAEADVSVTTFFRYFSSKEDVFLESMRAIHERFVRAIEERPAGVPVLRALREIVLQIVTEALGDPRFRKDLKELDSVPELRERLQEFDRRPRQALTQAFAGEIGVDATDLRPKVLTGAVIEAMTLARSAWLDDPGGTPLTEYVSQAFDVLEEMAEPVVGVGHRARRGRDRSS